LVVVRTERVLLLFNDMIIVAKRQKEEKKREERKRADTRQRLPPSLGPQGLGSDNSTYIIKEVEPLSQCKAVVPITDGTPPHARTHARTHTHILIDDSLLLAVVLSGVKPSFVITTLKRKYQMAVETDKIRSMWMETLLDAIAQWQTIDGLKRSNPSGAPPPLSPGTPPSGQRRRKDSHPVLVVSQ
jgi:hypothetical protein